MKPMDKELKAELQKNPTNDKVLLEMLKHKDEFLNYLSSVEEDPADQDGSEDLDEREDADNTDAAQSTGGEQVEEEHEDASDKEDPDINALIEAKVVEILSNMKRGKKPPKPKPKQKETKKVAIHNQFGAL